MGGRRHWHRLLLGLLAVIAVTLVVAEEANEVDVFDDVYMTGSCERDIQLFCKGIKPGESRLADCLTKQLNIEKKGIDDSANMLSDACKDEVHEFKVEKSKDFAINTKLEAACKEHVVGLCSDADPHKFGATIACLRAHKDKLNDKCKAEVFQTMEEAADDFTLDAALNEACSPDAKNLCSDVNPGEGRVQACLRSKRALLSWECQEELFRQEVENAEDIRLDARLRNACLVDKNKFCADVPPGNARVKDCLEDHRDDADFSPECKTVFEEMMERRAADFRLDPELTKMCAKDIEQVCGYEKDSLDAVAGFDGRVVECLQDYKAELITPECKEQVHKLTERAAQDVRFDEPLADACYKDRTSLCGDIPPGNARVIRCLQDQRDALSFECRATLFDQEVRMAEDIDFKIPMKKACEAEIQMWCKSVAHGHARVISCLRDKVDDVEMSEECQAEVKRDEMMSAQDYRLNYRLTRACEMDIDELCSDVCQQFMGSCGGTVLECLADNRGNISSDACKKELFALEKMQSEDWRNNAVLENFCKDDVSKFCKSIDSGGARVHRCLQDNLAQLSKDCRKEELKLMIVQSEDVRLRPELMKSCAGEMKQFCKDIPFGGGRIFSCLATYMGEVGFSSACEKEVVRTEKWRTSNYRLDPAVAQECRDDIKEFCAAEDKQSAVDADADPNQAIVLKCLVNHDEEVLENCGREIARAVKMALWMYQPNNPLTASCDADITNNCGKNAKGRRIMNNNIGANGRCLLERLDKKQEISPGCKVLIEAASDAVDRLQDNPTLPLHPGMDVDAIASQIESHLESKFNFMNYIPGSSNNNVQLTGWLAIAALAALFVVVVFGAAYALKRYYGKGNTYTLVMKSAKSGDV
eukprot:jgi/Chlat1/815/Chrsp104S01269